MKPRNLARLVTLQPPPDIRLRPVLVGHIRRALRLPHVQRFVLREFGAPELFGKRFRNHLIERPEFRINA